jgi:DNA-binding transcriptional regulator YiaG
MAKNPDLSKAPVPTRMRDLREKLGYNRKGDFARLLGVTLARWSKRRARLSTQPGYVRPAEKGHSRPDP